MIVALALAVAFACGVDPRRLGLLAAAVYFPWAVGAVVVWIIWKARPDEDHRPSLFCEGVAAELRAGSTLRDALATAATSVGSTDSTVNHPHAFPISEVAASVGKQFPAIAEELRLTVINAARSGSRAADLFDEIGSLAIAQSEIRREVRIATAPGRATAMLLVGAPAVYLAIQADSGGVSRMLESSQQRIVVMIGLALFFIGVVAAAVIVIRASR